jgi:magnesium chelatase family protein
VRAHVRLGPAARRALDDAYARTGLSTRGHQRVLRVARTIADLEDSDQVRDDHLLAALGLRQRDRDAVEAA